MRLTITGDAYALTSAIKVADIELLGKYNPDALTVTSGGKTRDENGYATITGTIPTGFASAEAAKEFVAEKFGGVVAYLEQLEKSVPEAAKAVTEKRKKLVDSITVA